MQKLEPKVLFRNLLIELVIYSVLIFGYYLLVLRFLDDWLFSIFQSDLVIYAIFGLGMIIIQAVFLDFVTSYLMRHIKTEQFGIRRVLDVFSDR